jgi:hypothetical protein
MDDSLRGEEAALVAVQSALADRPGVLRSARALSHFGEHSIGWLVVAAVGALLQAKRRRAWLAAGVGHSPRTPRPSSSSGWCDGNARITRALS